MRHMRWKWTPARFLATGFILVILTGSLLLRLPLSSADGRVAFIDALFTATSAVCVTGLVTLDSGSTWTWFGKAVLLVLIQIGALGFMTIVTFYATLTGRSLSLLERITLKDSIGRQSLHDVGGTFRRILLATSTIEVLGTVIFSFMLVPRYGWVNGIARSMFHAVSAFCNAGFDLFGTPDAPFASLTDFSASPLFLLVTAILIIIGGLGFTVWRDIVMTRSFHGMSLHAKIVVVSTGTLLLSGTVLFLLTEWRGAFASMQPGDAVMNAFFQSATSRTAGFNAIPLDRFGDGADLVTMVLMFIGAAPASTGGGVKVTTAFVLVIAMRAFFRGRSDTVAFRRRIPVEVVTRAAVVVMLSGMLVLLASFVLTLEGHPLKASLFEAVSAFATVGLSLGITPDLGLAGKIMLCVTMLAGRIGIISAFMAFKTSQAEAGTAFRYPEGEVVVG